MKANLVWETCSKTVVTLAVLLVFCTFMYFAFKYHPSVSLKKTHSKHNIHLWISWERLKCMSLRCKCCTAAWNKAITLCNIKQSSESLQFLPLTHTHTHTHTHCEPITFSRVKVCVSLLSVLETSYCLMITRPCQPQSAGNIFLNLYRSGTEVPWGLWVSYSVSVWKINIYSVQ